MKNKILKILFPISGAIPLLGFISKPPDPLLPIYSLFVFLYFVRNHVRSFITKIPLKPGLKFALLIFLIGMFAESMAWLLNFLKKSPEPALFHHQLVYDLLLGIPQYAAWGVVWYFLVKRFRYSLSSVFIIQGLYGVLLEQQGKIFLAGLGSMPVGLYMWAYVFAVYGSISAIAYTFVENEIDTTNKSNRKWLKYLVSLIAIMAITILFFIIWTLITNATGIIPEKRPIWEAPFW